MKQETIRRRDFLKGTSAMALLGPLGTAGAGQKSNAPSGKVHIACVGVGGKGWSDMHETSVGHNIVAICDIDENRLAKAAEKFPKAKRYTDWRKLLEQKDIDALTVSTPDHTHAPVAVTAMQAGKHIYGQKPLTHSVYEARRMREIAQGEGVITQMGIQHHATKRLKLAVQAIRDGVIGPVREVHAWTDRPGSFWKQGLERPTRRDDVPDSIHWDQWLGVAPERAYVKGMYHPFHWRGWWDFGTGALGDMGCHILDPVVGALELGPPQTIQADGPPPHPESGPLWCVVTYEFPGTRHTTEKVKVIWYEAGKQPPRDIFLAPKEWKGSKNGVLFVGARGNLFVGFPEMPELFPAGEFKDYQWADVQDHNHYREWTSAIAQSGTTSCPFEYSGPLTETVLLGNVAYRTGKTIHWDSAAMKAKGLPDADPYLRRDYRAGWDVPGLS